MTDKHPDYYECCSLCGMPKLLPSSRPVLSWHNTHEQVLCPTGIRVFCFTKGDTAETFWNYLHFVLVDLRTRSCTSSAIENRRAPEWIRQCALEEMEIERNVHRRERYERIANFCKRRAGELARVGVGSATEMNT